MTQLETFLKVAGDPKVMSFAGGLPAPELFPVEQVKKAADKVFDTKGPSALQYGSSQGELQNSNVIVDRLKIGINTDVDHGWSLLDHNNRLI